MRKAVPTLLIWVALIAVFLVIWKLYSGPDNALPQRPQQTFAEHLQQDRVAAVRIDGDRMEVTLDGGEQYATAVMDGALLTRMDELGLPIQYGKVDDGSSTRLGFVVLGVIALGLVIFLVLRRRMQGGAGSILSLRKSRARLLPEKNTAKFTDVGGAEEAKQELGDIIDFLKHPDAWKQAGVRMPRGVLLDGPPGCGKTLLARAVAGEAKVPFFFVSASEFVEMFVGVGAARVRDMFETATKKAPCILFIDELDAVGRRRGSGIGSAHDEREQTLNQLLFCMDGFETDARVVVVAATNRPDVLDKALVRPGRLDRHIRIPLPDRDARVAILEVHTRGKPLQSDVSLEALAEMTDGATGADLETWANDAALLTVRRSRREGIASPRVAMADFEEARRNRTRKDGPFDQLDQILVESASQLAQPTGKIVVRVSLRDNTTIEGELVWVDGNFIKLRRQSGDDHLIVPKSQIRILESLSGTDAVEALAADTWAHRRSELA